MAFNGIKKDRGSNDRKYNSWVVVVRCTHDFRESVATIL